MTHKNKFISTILFFVLILTFGCKQDYSNKTNYNLHIGKTFTLYVSENSCCINCWINKTSIKSIKLISEELVERADKDCDGCTSIYAWKFQGLKIGTDTITMARLSGGSTCADYKVDTIGNQEIFIVAVSK